MSTSGDDNTGSKDAPKASAPLDLARTQITTTTVGGAKTTPLLMTGQNLRGMRVLTTSQTGAGTGGGVAAPTIITTNILPQAVFKQENRAPSPSTATQRPAPIAPAYHVPRGPAVVANLAAPRGANVATVRAPMVVATSQPVTKQATRVGTTAWVAGAQKVTPRLASPTVKPLSQQQVIARPQPTTVAQIRSGTTILHSTIAIGQSTQLHPFKTQATNAATVSGGTTVQAVTIAQVLPPQRNQTLVYGTTAANQFAAATSRLVTANQKVGTVQMSRPTTTATRLTVPVNVTPTTRLVTPQATVLTSGARISAITTQQQTGSIVGAGGGRVLTTTPQAAANVTIGRLAVTPTIGGGNAVTATAANVVAQASATNVLNQARTFNIQSLVAVANSSPTRNAATVHATTTKVVAQTTPGAIHFAPIQTGTLKSSGTVVSNTNRTINVPNAIVNRTPVVVSSQPVPLANVYQSSNTDNVYVHTAPLRRQSPSPATTGIQSSTVTLTTGGVTCATPTTTTTSTAHPTAYFYETNYATSRPFGGQSGTAFVQNTKTIVANTNPMRFNPAVMVVPTVTATAPAVTPALLDEQQQQKVTSSPRPSILRKRDHEGNQLKAAKNLTSVLTGLNQNVAVTTAVTVTIPVAEVLSPPPRPDSRGNGHSSGGSTTISATSSPGIGELNEDSNPAKDDDGNKTTTTTTKIVLPVINEVSPRKKPRKQQLTGSNDYDEKNDDMQFISESIVGGRKLGMDDDEDADDDDADSEGNRSDEPRDGAPEAGRMTTVRKPASASLLNSYRQTWKATHNHYMRYTDVKPKDERRPTIMDLANQYRVQEKVNGWKIYHLSTQMEDLADEERCVYDQLNDLLKCTESQESTDFDKEVNRINELIKGNLQRIKIINDGMIEAKTQIMKIFDHKVHVMDIINRCASKRNFKKREKS